VLTNIRLGTQHIYTPEANFKTSSTQAVHLPEKFKVSLYLIMYCICAQSCPACFLLETKTHSHREQPFENDD